MPYTNFWLGNTPLATDEELKTLRRELLKLNRRLEQQLEERSSKAEDDADKLRLERKSDRTKMSKLSRELKALTSLLDKFGQRLDQIEKQLASPAFEKDIESMFRRQFERFEQSLQTLASAAGPEKPDRQDR